jgi:hypothetical protein
LSTNRSPIEERLLDQSAPPGSAEEMAALCLRSAAGQRPPGPVALARVRTRLAGSTAPSMPTRLRWKTILVLVAISAGVGGATGAAVWVAMPILKRARLSTPTSLVRAPLEPRVRAHRGRFQPPLPEDLSQAARPTDPEEIPSPMLLATPEITYGPEPMRTPAPIIGAPSGPPLVDPASRVPSGASSDGLIQRAGVFRKLARVERPSAPAISVSADLPTPAISQEVRLLGQALRSLRHDRDPLAALAALDAHAAGFPDSALQPEADITRVDALLALDRRQSALAVLDRLVIPATTRGRELAVVRAELRVGAKRYAEAIADFSRSLEGGGGGGDPLSERALHGRMACYLATRNPARAREDLRDYLIRFPAGRFAPSVRRSLDEIDGH